MSDYPLHLERCREIEEGSDRMCIAASPWVYVSIEHVFVDSCGLQARIARYQFYESGIGPIGEPDDYLFVELQDQSGWVEGELTVDAPVSARRLEEIVRNDYEHRYGLLEDRCEPSDA